MRELPVEGGEPLSLVESVEVPTNRGTARMHLEVPQAASGLLVVIGHGAGGGVDAPDLLAVRDAALGAGAVVARVEQPYRVAGRRTPAPAAQLDEAWCAAVSALRADRAYAGLVLISGGRSSGARVACRTAGGTGAAAVLALAFPLHPPGRPERSRAGELTAAGVPVLVVNGDRDPFGLPEAGPLVTVRVLAGADHSLRRQAAEVGRITGEWLRAGPWVRPAAASGG